MFASAGSGQAQMLDAAQIRPILEATKSNWVAVRDWNGQDLLYFTHLLTWRCGLDAVRFGLNGAPAVTPFEMPPCNEASPNTVPKVAVIYLTFDPGSITEVAIELTYDDAQTSVARFDRASILIP